VPVLTEYARAHGGRYRLFGSAARGQISYDSDVDLLLDFPEEAFGEAWNFAETACRDRQSEPDLLPHGDASRHSWSILRRICGCWHERRPVVEIEDAVASAVRHFSGAVSIYPKLATTGDRYVSEMAFLHAMLAGQTSLEAALLHILDLFAEEAPTGARRHADPIARATRRLGERPPILTGDTAAAAEETRRFRSIAAHAYDNFDESRAVQAVESAAALASLLPSEITRFRQAIDP
jgi:hypothetical protein